MAYFNRFSGCQTRNNISCIPLISLLIDLLTMNIHYLSTGTIKAHGQTLSYMTGVLLTHLWLKQSPPWDQQCLSYKLRLAETLEIFPPFLLADGPVYFPKITWTFSLPNSHSSRDPGTWQCLTSHLMVPRSTREFFKHFARGLDFITGIWEFLKNLDTRKFRLFCSPQTQTSQLWLPAITGTGPNDHHSPIQFFIEPHLFLVLHI